jgi:hypothetical protein
MDTLLLLFVLAAVVLLVARSAGRSSVKRPESDEADWAYGDEWKAGSPDAALPEEEGVFVEVMRCDGAACKDTDMLNLIGYLGSHGIRATYDTHSVAADMVAMKSYVLKVEIGKVEEARRLLHGRRD